MADPLRLHSASPLAFSIHYRLNGIERICGLTITSAFCIWSISLLLRHTEHLDWCLNGLSGAFILMLGWLLLFVCSVLILFTSRDGTFASHCKIPLCFCIRWVYRWWTREITPGNIEDFHSDQGEKESTIFKQNSSYRIGGLAYFFAFCFSVGLKRCCRFWLLAVPVSSLLFNHK